MKQSEHSRKLGDTLRSALAELLLREIEDPRLRQVSIVAAEVSPDRRVAKVFVTCDPQHYEKVRAGLTACSSRLRRLVGASLGWKYTPELRFEIDHSIDYAFAIEERLHQDD
ncbi:MAG: 30S ribosome-binding factor RbfA [Coriobacteriales bacterium]|jgi:ribosome-binding factor A|nr:30S ribosome-binding factor RbfA [Coriobacteriales bacterium]